MKRYAFLSVFLAAGTSTAVAVTPSADKPLNVDISQYKKGEIMVRVKPGTNLGTLAGGLSAYGVSSAKGLKLPTKYKGTELGRWTVLGLAAGQDEKKVLTRLLIDKKIESGQLNYRVAATAIPDDARFAELWGMHNTGATGVADADIDAPEAWDTINGGETLVAVIDTGVDYTHEDLAVNMWTNPGETPNNGIDDDGNGFVDDYYGYDFSAYDSDPKDEMGHGTHVAGTIAAVGNNAVGVTGVNWRSRIMAVRFLDANGSGWYSDAVAATMYAAANGARVTNNSWGGGGYDQPLYDAIKLAQDAGVLTVAAAGNNASDSDLYPLFPAAFDLPGIISVAASTASDGLAFFSNWGKVSVDLAAPGESILSTVPTATWLGDPSGYLYLNGTSMASPHVAGAAALLLAQNSTRNAMGVKQLLMQTVDSRPEFAGKLASNGRLNLNNAINCDPSKVSVAIGEPANGFYVRQNVARKISAVVGSCGETLPDAIVAASFSNGEATLALYDDGLHEDGAAGDSLYANSWATSVAGDLTITVEAQHPSRTAGSASSSGQVYAVPKYRIESAPYEWVDATVGGVVMSGGDDDIGYAYLDFPFPFYGVRYNNLFVSANGFLSFTDNAWGSFFNATMPSATRPNAVIAPFWDDLVGSTVYQLTDGVAPNRRTTIAWYKAKHYDATGAGSIAFQVSLYETTGEIVLRYNNVSFGNPGIDKGASATVGVEDETGTAASLVSYNQAVLADQTAIRLMPVVGNLAPDAKAGPDQTVQSRTKSVTLNGSASKDQDGSIVAYSWKQVSGPGVKLTNANQAVAKFSLPKIAKYPATLVFELTVTDNQAAQSSDSVTVTIVK